MVEKLKEQGSFFKLESGTPTLQTQGDKISSWRPRVKWYFAVFFDDNGHLNKGVNLVGFKLKISSFAAIILSKNTQRRL